MTNEVLYKNVMMAIWQLVEDKSVSVAKCRENIQALIEELEVILEGLGNEEE